MKPLTPDQYLAYRANVCPVCRSTDICGNSVEADGDNGISSVECNFCGSTWEDTWVVTGYQNLVKGTVPESDMVKRYSPKASLDTKKN
jgi:Zn ribbon nucleic-acid-binding protein